MYCLLDGRSRRTKLDFAIKRFTALASLGPAPELFNSRFANLAIWFLNALKAAQDVATRTRHVPGQLHLERGFFCMALSESIPWLAAWMS